MIEVVDEIGEGRTEFLESMRLAEFAKQTNRIRQSSVTLEHEEENTNIVVSKGQTVCELCDLSGDKTTLYKLL